MTRPNLPLSPFDPKHDLHKRVDNDFAYHAPDGDRKYAHSLVRSRCGTLAHFLVDTLPAGRELSTALTKLEEVMMWANAAIAREPESPEAA